MKCLLHVYQLHHNRNEAMGLIKLIKDHLVETILNRVWFFFRYKECVKLVYVFERKTV